MSVDEICGISAREIVVLSEIDVGLSEPVLVDGLVLIGLVLFGRIQVVEVSFD